MKYIYFFNYILGFIAIYSGLEFYNTILDFLNVIKVLKNRSSVNSYNKSNILK